VSLPCEWSWAIRLTEASEDGAHANVVSAEKF
jgi:hypothetical protein